MSTLPWDIIEEILARIPLTSMKTLLFTCKKWNNLLKDGSFTKKHLLAQEAASREGGKFIGIMMLNFDIFLVSFDFRGIYDIDSNNSPPFVNPKGKLISLDDSYKAEISQLCHCDGLLLCTTKDYNRLVVWNPYTGQIRGICLKSRSVDDKGEWYSHALGYEKSKSSCIHKILRFARQTHVDDGFVFEIFDLSSNLWRVFNINPNWRILPRQHGISLKGNTYWFAYDNESIPGLSLICFDFTTEIFRSNLSLPRTIYYDHAVILSSLREEQLAILILRSKMEIWVTTKIERNALSWSKFFVIDTEPHRDFAREELSYHTGKSFLIDEEKKAVIIFDVVSRTYITTYIFRENGYFKKVELGKLKFELSTFFNDSYPHACSYAPSCVQINQPA